jgi:hypothetical protein
MVGDARHTEFMEEQFTHIIDKGLLDCFLSGFGSSKNAACYLDEVNRIMRQSGCYIYITYAPPERRLRYLEEMHWDVKVFRLYRTSLEEQMIYFEEDLFAEEDKDWKSDFDKSLAENLTKPDPEKYRNKKNHWAYICTKKCDKTK